MKTQLLKFYIIQSLLVVASATPQHPNQPQPTTLQTSLVEACSAYSTAFNAALDLRVQGKLSIPEINSITKFDDQVAPICNGTVPSNPAIQSSIVQAAIANLTAIKQGK